jgi:hypothetical protein
MTNSQLQIFYHPAARLRMTIPNDKSYCQVRPAWAAPLSRPNKYLALLDSKGDEIVLIKELSELSADSLEAVQHELHQRYLTATVQAIHSARQEHGTTYWDADTDRGRREFITQNLQENALWLSPTHLLLLDVDGSRFEIPDIPALDERSHHIISSVL